MTSVILFRHGPAEARDPRRWPNDSDRPLARDGLAETRKAARGIALLEPRVRTVISSPAERARATAEIARKELGVDRALVLWPELGPDATASPILARLSSATRSAGFAMLVGHEPTLGELVGLCVSGDAISVARLGRAGAARIDFPQAPLPGGGVLEWLLTRKQLSQVAR